MHPVHVTPSWHHPRCQAPFPDARVDEPTQRRAAECLLCILSTLDACLRHLPHLEDDLAASLVPDLARAIRSHRHTQVGEPFLGGFGGGFGGFWGVPGLVRVRVWGRECPLRISGVEYVRKPSRIAAPSLLQPPRSRGRTALCGSALCAATPHSQRSPHVCLLGSLCARCWKRAHPGVIVF